MGKRKKPKTTPKSGASRPPVTPPKAVAGSAARSGPGVAVLFLHLAIIAVLTVIAYSNTLSSPFVFDDMTGIVNNPAIRDMHYFLDSSDLDRMMNAANSSFGFRARIIGNLTFAINYRLGGLNPTGYHVMNIAIHLAAALALYWLLTLLVSRAVSHSSDSRRPYRFVPLFGALIFATHPIQTQAVTYIVQRFASLAAMFYILSAALYAASRSADHRGRRWLWYVGAILADVLGMKTKEIVFTLPVMIAVIEFAFFDDRLRNRLLRLAPFAATLLIVPVSIVLNRADGHTVSGILSIAEGNNITTWTYLVTQFAVIMTYLRLIVAPYGQNLDYDYPVFHSFFTPRIVASFLVEAAIFVTAVVFLVRSRRMRGRYRPWVMLASFGFVWFFVGLSVESSVIAIADVIFEHRLYLPMAGISLAVVAAGLAGLDRFARGRTAMLLALPAAVIVALTVAAYERNAVWSTEETLWEDVAAKSPNKARVHNNLGVIYKNKGHVEDAIAQYERALEIQPAYAEADNNLGNALLDLADVYQSKGAAGEANKEVAHAIAEFRKAIRLKPDYAEAYNNLAVALRRTGDDSGAEGLYRRAIELKPDYADPHNNLGNIYFSKNQFDAAIAEYETALRIRPTYAEPVNNLGSAFFKKGIYDKALECFERAAVLMPNSVETRKNLETVRNVVASLRRTPQSQGRP